MAAEKKKFTTCAGKHGVRWCIAAYFTGTWKLDLTFICPECGTKWKSSTKNCWGRGWECVEQTTEVKECQDGKADQV